MSVCVRVHFHIFPNVGSRHLYIKFFITTPGSTFISPCQFSYFNIFMGFLIYNFFTIYISVLSAWIHATYMPGIPRGQKRATDSPEMKLPMAFSSQVGARN